MRTRLSLLLFLVAVGRAGPQAAPRVADSAVVPWIALSGRPNFADASRDAGIQYPDIMRAARVEGTVHLRVIVGADGAAERQSLHVDVSTHDVFTRSVETTLLRWKFAPPTLNGSAVRAQVPLRVSFVLPDQLDIPLQEANAVIADSAGVHITIGWKRVPQTVGLVADNSDVRAVTIGAMLELLKTLTAIPAGFACVGWDGTERVVPRDAFKALTAGFPGLKNANQCPPTFHSMIGPINPKRESARARKDPPMDPVWVSASNARPWTADLYVLQGSVSQGTMTKHYYCEARRANHDAPWVSTCEERRTSIS
jgi:TonB family protein